jgi:hypothetical protein
MPESKKDAIVPTAGALSWGAVTGRAPTTEIVPAAKPAAPVTTGDGMVTQEGRILHHGELRTVTRQEEIAARYGLDVHNDYERKGADQIEAIDRVAEAWAKHRFQRVERPEFHKANEAVNTVAADLHNVGSLIGNILFGD